MSEITYLSGWKPNLCIQFKVDTYINADFNRLLMKGCPSTKELQESNEHTSADREEFILLLKSRFDEALEEGSSLAVLRLLFNQIKHYLQWCDNQNIQAFTRDSLEGYMSHLNNQVMLGIIKNTTYTADIPHLI